MRCACLGPTYSPYSYYCRACDLAVQLLTSLAMTQFRLCIEHCLPGLPRPSNETTTFQCKADALRVSYGFNFMMIHEVFEYDLEMFSFTH